MTRPERQDRDERGETLVELLVAMAILGIAVVAIVAGLATSVLVSDVHRKQAEAGVLVRDYAAALQAAVVTSQAGYVSCGTPASYAPSVPAVAATGLSIPSGYTASVTRVQYWNGAGFASSCAAGDLGLQQLTLQVSSTDNRASEPLVIVLRMPCRPTDAPCSL